MKFKVGDWVIITKPRDLIKSPGWNPYMDDLLYRPVQIEKFIPEYNWYKVKQWALKEEWLTLAENYKEPSQEDKIIMKIHELDAKWKEKQQQKKGNLCA